MLSGQIDAGLNTGCVLAMKESQLNLDCGYAPWGKGCGRSGGNPSTYKTVSHNTMLLTKKKIIFNTFIFIEKSDLQKRRERSYTI